MYGKHWEMSAIVNFTQDLPQNTTAVQSEHTEQYSKSFNQQRHLEATFSIQQSTALILKLEATASNLKLETTTALIYDIS